MQIIHYLISLRYLNFSKIYNLSKVNISYVFSIVFKKNIVWGFPFRVGIEPVNFCNLSCPECDCGIKQLKRNPSILDATKYEKFILLNHKKLIAIQLFGQGEPFLHAELPKLIHIAHLSNLYTSTSTNGHFLNEVNCEKIIRSGLDKILISLDGTNQQVYEMYRAGGDFQTVTNGIKTLATLKTKLKSKKPFIAIQFLVFKHNQHQMKDLISLAKNLGANGIEFKSAQINSTESQIKTPDQKYEKFSRYRKNENGVLKLKKKLRFCYRLWSSLTVFSDGTVTACCYDKSGKFSMGNIFTENPQKIWEKDQFNQFRLKILLNKNKPEMCKNCIG